MLVLSRKLNETIRIGNDIVITVCRVNGDSVKIGIEAPREIAVDREEVRAKKEPK
jgi:carbon storage regulator